MARVHTCNHALALPAEGPTLWGTVYRHTNACQAKPERERGPALPEQVTHP